MCHFKGLTLNPASISPTCAVRFTTIATKYCTQDEACCLNIEGTYLVHVLCEAKTESVSSKTRNSKICNKQTTKGFE